MDNNPTADRFKLAVVIVNFGAGSKVLRIAKQHGVPNGTVYLGMGTTKNRILEFLELNDVRKEIVVIIGEESAIDDAVKNIDKELELRKPYHGIGYTMALSVFRPGKDDNFFRKNEGEKAMYNVITIIVDKGEAEDVMDTATGAGARGGTIIKARGTGTSESGKLFHMDIEPEKEILLILSESSSAEKIIQAVREVFEKKQHGTGVIFCQDVNSVYGIS